MRAARSTTTSGPIATSFPSTASGAITADGCTPVTGRSSRAKIASASANERYGCGERSIAHGATSASSARMIADARVCCTAGTYFGFARNVMSPGPAASTPATRTMSREPSPSRRQPSRSASSESFTEWKGRAGRTISRARGGHAVDERRQMLEAERRRDGLQARLPRSGVLDEQATQLRQRRSGLERRADARERLTRAANREVVADDTEREVVRDQVGTRQQRQ